MARALLTTAFFAQGTKPRPSLQQCARPHGYLLTSYLLKDQDPLSSLPFCPGQPYYKNSLSDLLTSGFYALNTHASRAVGLLPSPHQTSSSRSLTSEKAALKIDDGDLVEVSIDIDTTGKKEPLATSARRGTHARNSGSSSCKSTTSKSHFGSSLRLMKTS